MSGIRVGIQIRGIVQGVGFRPFLHRKMKSFGLNGWIRNTSDGVELEAEGSPECIEAFLEQIRKDAPPLAEIDEIRHARLDEFKNYNSIRILPSQSMEMRDTLISPDVAVCKDCLRELFDPSDRRYRYPFINCTNCGPRFSIIRDVPYDRCNTTMESFVMCKNCEAEYGNIENRRYHAQPDCCGECGPELFFLDRKGRRQEGDSVLLAAEKLKSGAIIAVKGLGGIHLACRWDDPEVVGELRRRKHREEKPFAVMFRDAADVRGVCVLSPEEEAVLCGHERPIVLLRKRKGMRLEHLSDNRDLGVMLPYTPMHYLLLDAVGVPLVMTSANISDLPILTGNGEALFALDEIADGFLLHNREIENRCDDSLVRVLDGRTFFLRRSRGYAPAPLKIANGQGNTLACGAEQKASFCLSRGQHVFLSAHIGDLKNAETLLHYERQIALFEKLFDLKPGRIACDLHPDYLSTEYARRRAQKDGCSLTAVQHHHAHMASCMADNSIEGKCIGVIWDGTGYGTDGTIWGGEFLTGDYCGFERAGSLRQICLPGGDRAIREIRRIGIALVLEADENPESFFEEKDVRRVSALLEADLNCPRCSGMGRLFDGVCAILGIRGEAGYEGQGAILLEASADEGCEESYPVKISAEDGMYVFDWRSLIRAVCDDVRNGVERGMTAARFMNTLVCMARKMCGLIRETSELNRVVLSGGVFQNVFILERLTDGLKRDGFEVYRHSRVSTNDEGISFGQLIIAERGGGYDVSCGTIEDH